jgi:putative AlgH/UPF0301 family transcriptional regulator
MEAYGKILLIAMPAFADALFSKTVVYMCEHSSRGAMGLVINKPADISMTRQIMDAGKPLGVMVHDHIIIGRQGHSSLRGMNLI